MRKRLRVLLADNDDDVRETISSMLKELGHEVSFTARDGGEAFGIFEQNRGRVDCVLTDCQMPKMNGLQLAIGIRVLQPEMPIILMSGNGPPENLSATGVQFLNKPMRLEDLMRVIKEACGEKKP